jgi:4-amino-4-deoxy-L-arabinose transferase-like glycosyltransferase
VPLRNLKEHEKRFLNKEKVIHVQAQSMLMKTKNPLSHLSKSEVTLLIFFMLLLVFPLQYISRSLDMSTLTSWRWVFTDIGPGKIILFILLGVLAAIPLANIELPQTYPASFLFLVSFFCSLPFLNSSEVLLDSTRYFLQAKQLSQFGFLFFFKEWGGEINQWTDLPLVPFLYGVLFKLFGEKKIAVEIFNVLIFSMTPVLTYLTGRILWDSEIGFVGGLFVLTSPYLFTQTPLMLVDIHTMFFLLLAVCTFLYSIERRGPSWIFASAVTVLLASICKFSTWPILGVLIVIVFIYMGSDTLAVIKHAVLVAMVTILLLAIIYFWKGEVIAGQIQFLSSYQIGGLKRWQEGYLSALIFQTHPLLLLAALLGIIRSIKNLDKKILIMAWFAALVFFLELKRVRYLLPLLPFYALAGAYGLQTIKQQQVRRFFVYGCVVTSLVIALGTFKPFLNSTSMTNLKDAGRFIDTLPSEAVRVLYLPQEKSLGNTAVVIPILDLYTEKLIYAEQPWKSEMGLKKAQNASLRFTWELSPPRFYRDEKYSTAQLPLVIIASKPIHVLPPFMSEKYPHYQLLKQFSKTSAVYRYQTHVSIFEIP